MPSVTIRDVAKEAGVSIATVSYVLNDSRPVAKDTRQSVLQAAHRLGYRANITARNLQARETRLFGYSWRPSPPGQFHPVLDRFLASVTHAAANHGYRLLTFTSNNIADELATYQEMMLVNQVDGFILTNTNIDDQRVARLLDAGFPFVSFGRANDQWDFAWVDVDGAAGLRLVTEHLIALGHQRIACLVWPEGSLTGRERLQGYLDAMANAGLAVEADWVMIAENTHDDAYLATQRLLALPPDLRPSAVVALTDLMAIGVMNAASNAGLTVGRDLAVTGFDDAPITRFLHPPLTSLSQPLDEVGERLVSMLVGVLRGQPVVEPRVLLLPKLVIRASSATPYA
jgi:DNA-binding LacI/PurR family transcriptional regulator